jgi:hypothetical protein
MGVADEEIRSLWAVGDEGRAAIARGWFEGRRAGMEVAWLSFTKNQQKGLLPDGFDRSVRNLAVFNSTIEEYDSIVMDKFLYDDEVIGFRRVLESLRSRGQKVHVYLRVHPNLKNIPRDCNYQLADYTRLTQEHDNLTVIWPESVVHSYALLDACDTVLTFGSTIGAEATFWGRPSVLAGRALYERLGCCYLPSSHEDLIDLLSKPLDPKPVATALPYGHWEATKGTRYRRFVPDGLFAGSFDGRKVLPTVRARLQAAALRVIES